ncbi:hypothetical protein CK625_02585 [Vandammella animalimorsus]|uniref:Uncharacterized protein n=2 Tax=Vandammella animalimorsus TaxID=2029117 RepID=A0A2A2AKZ9_9BURK|nr:hypothetical protein CK625_02585 [Vandammella animalimorsus]
MPPMKSTLPPIASPALLGLLLAALLLTALPVAAQPASAQPANSQAAAQATPPQAEASADPQDLAEGKRLGQFVNRYGFRHLYVRVPVGLDDARIIALAQQWHQREPDAWLWLLDDDSQFQQLLGSLPKIEQGDLGDFPAQWFKQHAVANLVLMLHPDRSRRWALYRGAQRSDSMAELPCIQGKGGCKP